MPSSRSSFPHPHWTARSLPCPHPQFGVLVGSVQFPPPPGAPAPAAGANGAAAAPSADNDLASALVKAGLARTAEWGLNMMTTGSFRLRELGGWQGSMQWVALLLLLLPPPPLPVGNPCPLLFESVLSSSIRQL